MKKVVVDLQKLSDRNRGDWLRVVVGRNLTSAEKELAELLFTFAGLLIFAAGRLI